MRLALFATVDIPNRHQIAGRGPTSGYLSASVLLLEGSVNAEWSTIGVRLRLMLHSQTKVHKIPKALQAEVAQFRVVIGAPPQGPVK